MSVFRLIEISSLTNFLNFSIISEIIMDCSFETRDEKYWQRHCSPIY